MKYAYAIEILALQELNVPRISPWHIFSYSKQKAPLQFRGAFLCLNYSAVSSAAGASVTASSAFAGSALAVDVSFTLNLNGHLQVSKT